MDGIDYLRFLFDGISGAYTELRFIHPVTTDRRRMFVQLPINDGYGDWLRDKVQARNREGYGVYYRFGLSRTRSSLKADIDAITALWCDIDDVAGIDWIDDLHYRVDGEGQQGYSVPNVVISSGGGWHGIWLLHEPLRITNDNRTDIERTLKGIAIALQGDTSVSDVTRIFRLPGTINTKPERGGVVCHIHDMVGGWYGYDDIAPFAQQHAPKPRPRPKQGLPLVAFNDDSLPGWVEDYLTTGAAQGERNVRLFAVACEFAAMGKTETEAEAILGPRAAADGLEQHEINRTIRSAYRKVAREGIKPKLTERGNRMTWRDK